MVFPAFFRSRRIIKKGEKIPHPDRPVPCFTGAEFREFADEPERFFDKFRMRIIVDDPWIDNQAGGVEDHFAIYPFEVDRIF